MKKKAVDDVMGGEDAWKNADKNESKSSPKAYAASNTGLNKQSKGLDYLANSHSPLSS